MLGHGRQNRADCEMEGGDLGLGRGLKPGAISKEETNLEFSPTDRDSTCTSTNNATSLTETEIHIAKCVHDMSFKTQQKHYIATGTTTDYDSNISFEAHPVSEHSIAIGTSLQQQKQLFNMDLDYVRRNINISQENCKKCNYADHVYFYFFDNCIGMSIM